MGDLTRRAFNFLASCLPFGILLSDPPFPSPNQAPGNTGGVPAAVVGKYVGIKFTTPAGITDRLAWLERNLLKAVFGSEGGFWELHLTMPCCGKQYFWASTAIMPIKTLPCPCGKPGYFVVEWDEALPPLCKRCDGKKVVCIRVQELVDELGVIPGLTRGVTRQVPCPECSRPPKPFDSDKLVYHEDTAGWWMHFKDSDGKESGVPVF